MYPFQCFKKLFYAVTAMRRKKIIYKKEEQPAFPSPQTRE